MPICNIAHTERTLVAHHNAIDYNVRFHWIRAFKFTICEFLFTFSVVIMLMQRNGKKTHENRYIDCIMVLMQKENSLIESRQIMCESMRSVFLLFLSNAVK